MPQYDGPSTLMFASSADHPDGLNSPEPRLARPMVQADSTSKLPPLTLQPLAPAKKASQLQLPLLPRAEQSRLPTVSFLQEAKSRTSTYHPQQELASTVHSLNHQMHQSPDIDHRFAKNFDASESTIKGINVSPDIRVKARYAKPSPLNQIKRVQSSNFTLGRMTPQASPVSPNYQYNSGEGPRPERRSIRKANTEGRINQLSTEDLYFHEPDHHGSDEGEYDFCNIYTQAHEPPLITLQSISLGKSEPDEGSRASLGRPGRRISIFDHPNETEAKSLSNRELPRSPISVFEASFFPLAKNSALPDLQTRNNQSHGSGNNTHNFNSFGAENDRNGGNLPPPDAALRRSQAGDNPNVFERLRALEKTIIDLKSDNDVKCEQIKLLSLKLADPRLDLKALCAKSALKEIRVLRKDNTGLRARLRELEELLGPALRKGEPAVCSADLEAKVSMLRTQNGRIRRKIENYKHIVEHGTNEDVERCIQKIHDLEFIIKDVKRRNDRLEAQLLHN